jgi:putative ubiquitin-RnfH superfamily antitoxin RatB of RatAB toxin-antitoxin module
MASDDQPVAAPVEMLIEVVDAAGPHHANRVAIRMVPGATLADALRISGLAGQVEVDDSGKPRVGIWCRAAALDTLLRDRDRVEIYRPLQVDPKEARRQRYRRDKLGRSSSSRPA